MAAAIPDDTPPGSAILDLSAGDGGLLIAALHARPDLRVVAIEQQPALAITCALNILAARKSLAEDVEHQPRHHEDRVIVGDGLAASTELAQALAPKSSDGAGLAVILGNPPYVGEKGNRALFEAIKREHPHLTARVRARVDLSYLFLHRALDLLPEGGRLVYLTSEYWLMASGADVLREDLAARSEIELFLRVDGQPLFQDAPGHHSLITVARRAPSAPAEQAPMVVELTEVPAGDDWPEVMRGALESSISSDRGVVLRAAEQGWQPFGDVEERLLATAWREKHQPLSTFVQDRQGFVSGADRVTRRHLRILEDAQVPPRHSEDGVGEEEIALPELGAPVFLMERDEVPEALAVIEDALVKPLIRGSEVVSGRIWLKPPGSVSGLYIDGELEGELLEAVSSHLEVMRPVLERRREVERGRMPWYRLHWPRSRSEQEGPKLVCARRAAGPVFGLDLSGSFISSDCTYLIAREGATHPVRELLRVLIALSMPETRRDLRCFGKRKGSLYELYSEPLRSMPLALELSQEHGDGGEVVFADEAVEEAWGAVISRLEREITAPHASSESSQVDFVDLFEEVGFPDL